MLLRLIDVTSSMKVDIGKKMLIEPIYFWLVASQYYKKLSIVSMKKSYFSV